MSLERALKNKMRWISTHKSNEVPVLDSGGTVSQHVSNELGVDLSCGVESETGLEVFVSNVSVNSRWDVDDVSVDLVGLEILGNLDAVGKTVSGANNDEAGDTVLLALSSKCRKVRLIELILRFSKVVIATKVAVWSEGLLSQLNELFSHNTISTIHISIYFKAFTLLLELEETVNNIVATW